MNAEGYGEGDFEYDAEDTEDTEDMEDNESGDEGLGAEASDESDEGSDESVFEADEANDEADESETIGSFMEADESEADEADESDEGFGEAVRMSASARLRANQDRNRRAEWSRRIAADQRVEAQRAASAQRAITSRIRAIPITTKTKLATVGTLRGAGVVTAILPNGRRTRMRIIPTVAPITEVNRLRGVVLANEKRQATAITTNAKAVASLAAAQTATVKRLTAQQLKSDKELSRRLAQGDNRLDARITKELSGGSGILDKHGKRMLAAVRRERRRGMMNNVLLATSVPFFLSYGDRETPFTTDNAIIAGSTLFWLLGDDAISSWSSNKGFMQGLASVWSYGAPIANGGGLYWWFRNKQNQRFIAGVTDVPTDKAKEVNVAALLKKDADKDLTGHSVVASFVDGSSSGTVSASLNKEGTLTLALTGATASPPAAAVKVAWIVDTKPVPKSA